MPTKKRNVILVVAALFLIHPLTLHAAFPITTASPGEEIYATAKTVTLTPDNPSATIYYTTDGSVPTTASSNGTSPVTINIITTTVLKFFTKYGTHSPWRPTRSCIIIWRLYEEIAIANNPFLPCHFHYSL